MPCGCDGQANPRPRPLAAGIDAQADVRRSGPSATATRSSATQQNHPASARNAVWDGRVVRLFGARNEIIAFQVIVEADGAASAQLSVRLPELVSATDRITYQPPASGSHRLRGPADPDLHAQLHARRRRRRMRPGSSSADRRPRPPIRPAGSRSSSCPRTPARAGRLAGLDRARTRTRRSGSRSTSRRRARAGVYRGTISSADRRARADSADRARGFRLHPAGREQHARDAVLLERSGRALPRSQPGCGVPPSRAPPPRRARARLRREDALQAAWGRFSGRGFHRRLRATRVPATGWATSLSRGRSTAPGADFDDRAQRLGARAIPG